jgi:hypothetical protein
VVQREETMASLDYVRVVCGVSSVSVDPAAVRIYWDIAEAGAIKHLGKTIAAKIPASAVHLRGPVAATAQLSSEVICTLRACPETDLSSVIDPARATNGAWFLLDIDSPLAGERHMLREVYGRLPHFGRTLAALQAYLAVPPVRPSSAPSRQVRTNKEPVLPPTYRGSKGMV